MRTSGHMIELDIAIPRPSVLARMTAVIAGSMTAAWRVLKNRHSANRLGHLDDHQLDDIGLTRPELQAILHATALYEDPTCRLARSARLRGAQALRRKDV